MTPPKARLPLISGRNFFEEAEQQLYPNGAPYPLGRAQREQVTALAKQLYASATGQTIS
jgi:hypothetical protein